MARNYKQEYEDFQSSEKMKKKRAKLNKYNRDKGTYGNGDGLDASHKMERFLDLYHPVKIKVKRKKVE